MAAGRSWRNRWWRPTRCPANARILDVGCGRGFLLYEFTRLLPGCTVAGFDVSDFGLATAKEEVRPFLTRHDARLPFPYRDGAFDLAISINALHNLPPEAASRALAEMQRVATDQYLVVESFRTPEELFNLQCWALTCEIVLPPRDLDLAVRSGRVHRGLRVHLFRSRGSIAVNSLFQHQAHPRTARTAVPVRGRLPLSRMGSRGWAS